MRSMVLGMADNVKVKVTLGFVNYWRRKRNTTLIQHFGCSRTQQLRVTFLFVPRFILSR